jgi:hypothetical protein
MIKRYAVLDADGIKVNTITADEALIASGWYPGYGALLVDEGENPPDPLPPPPVVKPETWGTVYPKLAEPMQTGDKLDVNTGEVIKRVEASEPIEPIDGGK